MIMHEHVRFPNECWAKPKKMPVKTLITVMSVVKANWSRFVAKRKEKKRKESSWWENQEQFRTDGHCRAPDVVHCPKLWRLASSSFSFLTTYVAISWTECQIEQFIHFPAIGRRGNLEHMRHQIIISMQTTNRKLKSTTRPWNRSVSVRTLTVASAFCRHRPTCSTASPLSWRIAPRMVGRRGESSSITWETQVGHESNIVEFGFCQGWTPLCDWLREAQVDHEVGWPSACTTLKARSKVAPAEVPPCDARSNKTHHEPPCDLKGCWIWTIDGF